MKFNRQRFIDETCGNLDAAMDCIDTLIDALNGYIIDDELSELHGCGCYGKNAMQQVLSRLKDKQIYWYLDR